MNVQNCILLVNMTFGRRCTPSVTSTGGQISPKTYDRKFSGAKKFPKGIEKNPGMLYNHIIVLWYKT